MSEDNTFIVAKVACAVSAFWLCRELHVLSGHEIGRFATIASGAIGLILPNLFVSVRHWLRRDPTSQPRK